MKSHFFILIVLVLCLALSSCSGDGSVPAENTPPAAPTEGRAEGDRGGLPPPSLGPGAGQADNFGSKAGAK